MRRAREMTLHRRLCTDDSAPHAAEASRCRRFCTHPWAFRRCTCWGKRVADAAIDTRGRVLT
eukprot:230284-Rhodomonas_salina.2